MAGIEGLTIGLSIVLGGFVLVLLAELYYLIYWKCWIPWNRRIITDVVTKSTEGGFNFPRGGLVRSLRSHSMREAANLEISATLCPISPGVTDSNDNLYMQGVLEGPRLLFTIKEETKEDMECEESVVEHMNMFSDSEQRMAKSQRPSRSKSPSTNSNSIRERCYHQLQKQWRDLHSIGLLPQQQKMQESHCYWKSPFPSSRRINLPDLNSQPFSSCSSPPSAPNRFVSLSSPRSSSARNGSMWPYRKRQSFYAITSNNTIYDTDKMLPLPTPLGTSVSFTCRLDTPPLTPMRASLAAYSIPLSTSAMSSVSF